MSLLDRIVRDARRIVGNRADFSQLIEFRSKEGKSAFVFGLAKKHHTTYDEVGNEVSSMNASVTISFADLDKSGYVYRTAMGEPSFRDHIVKWKDASGNEVKYEIISWRPDDILGIVVCILGGADYGENTNCCTCSSL